MAQLSRHGRLLVLLLLPTAAAAVRPEPPAAYPLMEWQGGSCGAKGRFQDREYCRSDAIDRIVADGKQAIPILISQITDERRMREPVLDFRPPFRVGELAILILDDLFLDQDWKRRTMPDLFPDSRCKAGVPERECWTRFRAKHSLATIQARWFRFWQMNERLTNWDEAARCFRVRREGDMALPGIERPLSGWKLAGRYVAEQAVYDAMCAATLDDLCRALDVMQEGLLVVRDDDVWFLCDAECCELPFRAGLVESDRAEGWFERPDDETHLPQKRPCAGDSCIGRRVQIWLEGEALVLRGAMERVGACDMPDDPGELETTLLRFVPLQRLNAAAAERASRLGVDLRGCNSKTLHGAGPPRPCWTGEARSKR